MSIHFYFFIFFFPFLFVDNSNFDSLKRSSLENSSEMLLQLLYHLRNPIIVQHKFGPYFPFVSFSSFYKIIENGKKSSVLRR